MELLNKIKDKEFLKSIRKDTVVNGKNFKKEYIHKDRILKLSKDDKYIELKLISSLHSMVKAGKCVKVAELEILNYRKKTNLFNGLKFIDKKASKYLDKNFVYKYAPLKTVKIDLPELERLPEEKRFIEKEVADWENAVEFSKLQELPKEKVRIGVFTDTTLGEKVEWIPTIEGIDILEWADYDVTEIDSLEHDTLYGRYNSLVMIDSTHFILAYQGNGSDGFIKTFSIDGSYEITEIDSLEHDIVQCYDNSLVMIDSTHFMLAYRGVDSDGFIKTFSIDGSYDNITEIDSLEHDEVQGYFNSLVMIDSTHFMLAYSGTDFDGFIKTFSIDGSYDNITEIDSLEHDTINGRYNSLVKIDSTHFILAYQGVDSDGFIKTFSIDGSYEITETDSLEHDIVYNQDNSLVMIDSTHFILAYQGADYDGFIKTFSIDGSYEITEIDSLEHDTSNGAYNSLVMIDSTHFILAYAGVDEDGFIKTFSIDGSHEITEITSLEQDTTNGTYNSLVMIDATHFILAYAGDGLDGFIKTFSIEVAPAGTNIKINIGDSWKEVSAIKINIGDSWKEVSAEKINIGDNWKVI